MQINSFSVSRISLQSNKRSAHSKHSPSTAPQESPEQKSSNSTETWEEDKSSLHYSKLCSEIQRIQRCQQEMQAKYSKYIEHMLAEIEKNNASNARLAREVTFLCQQISESNKDIQIIDSYLKSKSKQEHAPIQHTKTDLRRERSRECLGSSSRSKNILTRRTPSKLFKSKLTIKS